MEKSKTLEKSPTRLGRGLSALIPPQAMPSRPAPAETPVAPAPAPATEAGGAQELPLSAIIANPSQPRTVFAQSALDDLTASVRLHGVLQPVMVRPRGGGRYELVAGERRFRAAQEAGLTRIPAVVRSLTDEESLTVALIENIQREDLNPIEAARGYKQLMDEYGLTQTQLGAQINKQQSTISNTVRLLNLPEEMQESICDGTLTEAHGKALLSLKDAGKQRKVWQDAVTRKLTVKETEQAVRRAETKDATEHDKPTLGNDDLHWGELENRLRTSFGMKTTLNVGAKGAGVLTVKFSGPDQLEDLLERLRTR